MRLAGPWDRPTLSHLDGAPRWGRWQLEGQESNLQQELAYCPRRGGLQRGETEIPRETEDRDRARGDKTGGRRGQRGAEERKGREQRDRERERPREGERRREGGERDRGRQTDAETERQRGRPREGWRQRGARTAGLGDGGRWTPEPLSPRASESPPLHCWRDFKNLAKTERSDFTTLTLTHLPSAHRAPTVCCGPKTIPGTGVQPPGPAPLLEQTR